MLVIEQNTDLFVPDPVLWIGFLSLMLLLPVAVLCSWIYVIYLLLLRFSWGEPMSDCNKLTMCVVRINAGEWKCSLTRVLCSLYWWAGCCKLLLFSSRRFKFREHYICLHSKLADVTSDSPGKKLLLSFGMLINTYSSVLIGLMLLSLEAAQGLLKFMLMECSRLLQ